MPLRGLPPKPMDENKRPLGVIRLDVNRRKPHQRVCGNTHFVAVEIEVDVHAGSLHEAGMDVNFEKQKTCTRIFWCRMTFAHRCNLVPIWLHLTLMPISRWDAVAPPNIHFASIT